MTSGRKGTSVSVIPGDVYLHRLVADFRAEHLCQNAAVRPEGGRTEA